VRRRIQAALASRAAKVFLFVLCLVPLALLALRLVRHQATANPIEFVEHWFGDWTMRFLLLTLAVTPARKLLHLPLLIRYRRMLGLFAFFYVCLHFLAWLVLDHFFAWHEMWADVLKRRYITVGFAGFVLLVPRAITSTKGWIRRLGKRWQRLHRLVYATAVLGVIHYWWLVKSDHTKPLQYALILAALFAGRLLAIRLERRRGERSASRPLPEPLTAESAISGEAASR